MPDLPFTSYQKHLVPTSIQQILSTPAPGALLRVFCHTDRDLIVCDRCAPAIEDRYGTPTGGWDVDVTQERLEFAESTTDWDGVCEGICKRHLRKWLAFADLRLGSIVLDYALEEPGVPNRPVRWVVCLLELTANGPVASCQRVRPDQRPDALAEDRWQVFSPASIGTRIRIVTEGD